MSDDIKDDHSFPDFQEGPASVEVSVDKEGKVVWLKLGAGNEEMEMGIPVNHAYMISQALAAACHELGYDPSKHGN